MTDHSLDHSFLREDADAVKAIANRLERLTCDLAVTGIVPFIRGGATWHIQHTLDGADGARVMLFKFFDLADVLAAQTAALADSGSLRAAGDEATALRQQAATMRMCRRAVADLRREIATLCGNRGGTR
jgi:hypothetical protein